MQALNSEAQNKRFSEVFIFCKLLLLLISMNVNAEQQDSVKLNEIVVVGYKTTTKGSFTGSATHINPEYNKNSPIQSFEQLLAGKEKEYFKVFESFFIFNLTLI